MQTRDELFPESFPQPDDQPHDPAAGSRRDFLRNAGLLGAAALPPAWIDPIEDRYATSLPGFDGVSFTELARRTIALAGRAS